MAEYIEREALLREIERREALMIGDKLVSVDAMKSFIKNRQATDVAPVRHGKWLPTTKWWQGGSAWKQCSECGILHCGKSPYCPNCGCMMDLEG